MSKTDIRYRIKAIMDSIFAEKTSVRHINVLKHDEHDDTIFEATVFDAECGATFKFFRNADGSYCAYECE